MSTLKLWEFIRFTTTGSRSRDGEIINSADIWSAKKGDRLPMVFDHDSAEGPHLKMAGYTFLVKDRIDDKESLSAGKDGNDIREFPRVILLGPVHTSSGRFDSWAAIQTTDLEGRDSQIVVFDFFESESEAKDFEGRTRLANLEDRLPDEEEAEVYNPVL